MEMTGMMKKSTAILAMAALAMLAFAGLIVADVEPELTEPALSIEDTFAPFDDMNAYTIVDTFTFSVPGYGAGYNNSNITMWIKIGPFDYDPMEWNDTNMEWTYVFAPDSPAYVGTHDVHVKAFDTNNATNENMSAVHEITIWHPVLVDDTFTMPEFSEDMTTAWNVSDAFLPEFDVTGEPLMFGFGPEGAPDGWTFEPMMVDNYTHWHVTPPADYFGWVHVNVTAADTNGVGPGAAYKMFNISVAAVNDAPVIEGIMIGDDMHDVEEMEIVTGVNETGHNITETRMVVHLPLLEDEHLMFSVIADDVDSETLTYMFMMDDEEDPYMVEVYEYVNETNVTVVEEHTFVLTPDPDANGMFWGMIQVSDGDLDDTIWAHIMVEAVNDAPVLTSMVADMTEAEVGENITFTAAATDVDGDELTYIWKVGTEIIGNMSSITVAFDEAGWKNVTVTVSDGELEVMDYVMVNITEEEEPPVNNPPTITMVQAIPVGMSAGDTVDFLLKGEVEEGKDISITCLAVDLDGDTLTYTWTNNVDATWTKTTTTGELVVSAEDLEVGKSYTFTCVVTDGMGGEDTETSNTIKIVEKEDPSEFGMIIIVIIVVIAIIAIIAILFFILKGGKKEEEEEAPEEEEESDEGEMPEEEPLEGMEGEMPEEEPLGMEGEMPEEEPLKEEGLPEEDIPEETEEIPPPPMPPQ
ncbi:MAG: PKD domain-containing protein [Candidatus Thermoplasmatota archaeon]|nr:PKD domain-containing protein [Candidatus Thermoplasmatota archaeon]